MTKVPDYQKFLNEWSKRKVINGKSFDDLFQIDGVPLWWFYRKFFYAHVMPKPLQTYSFLERNQPLTFNKRLRLRVHAFFLKKYLMFIEKKKISYFRNKKKSTKSSLKTKILFLSYTNHVSSEGLIFRLEKLIKKIRNSKGYEDFVLFVDPLRILTYKNLLGLNNPYFYCDKKIEQNAQITSQKLFDQWHELDKKTKIKLFEFEGRSLWPYLESGFDFFFSKEFFYLYALYYELFKKILREENIKLAVITGTVSVFEKCLIALSKHMRIPLLRINHGISIKNYSEKEVKKSDLLNHGKEAVMSEYSKKLFQKAGIKNRDLIVTGPVVYDEIKPFIVPKKIKEKNILIATSCPVEANRITKNEYFRRMNRLLNEINKINNVKVAIKPHPRDTQRKLYLEIIKKNHFKNVKIYSSNLSRNKFYSLLRNCDLFIHFGSNSALEAMIINRPILTINLLEGIQHIEHWLRGKGATVEISYFDDIYKAVKNSLGDELEYKVKRREFVRKYCGKIDGKASQKVEKLIYSLIENK